MDSLGSLVALPISSIILCFKFVSFYLLSATVLTLIKSLRSVWGPRREPNPQRAVLITGATSGLGLAAAKRLHRLGFSVFAAYYNQQEPGYGELEKLSRERGAGKRPVLGHLFLIHMDVRSRESIRKAAVEIDQLLGEHRLELYCLINNAGVCADGPFEWCAEEGLEAVFQTNLLGLVRVTKEFVGKIVASRGRVINVSSGIHLFPVPTLSAYGSSKSAVTYLSESLNADLRPYGASCHCILPTNLIMASNIVYTRLRGLQESLGKLSEEERQLYGASIRFNRAALYSLLRRKFAIERLSGADLERLERTYAIELPAAELIGGGPKQVQRRGRRSSNSLIKLANRGVLRLLELFSGTVRSADIGQSGAIDAFELAVCLERPPSRLYAGPKVYALLGGPLTDWLPVGLLRALATNGAQLMFR